MKIKTYYYQVGDVQVSLTNHPMAARLKPAKRQVGLAEFARNWAAWGVNRYGDQLRHLELRWDEHGKYTEAHGMAQRGEPGGGEGEG